MNEKLQQKAELMAANSAVVRKSAKLDFNEAANLGALLFTAENAVADEATIRANRKILKENTSIFSNMRGAAMNLSLLARMSMQEDPQAWLDDVMDAYGVITQSKIYRDESLVLAAIHMAETLEPEEYEGAAQKAWATLAQMNAAHPLLTGQEDYTLALLLSQADMDVAQLLEDAEEIYQALKPTGFTLSKNSLQSVSIILALSQTPKVEACVRFDNIRKALKQAGHRIGADELAIVASLVDADASVDQLVEEIAEVDEYLKHQKGFGILSGGAQLRRVFASALVNQVHADDETGTMAATGRTAATIICEEIISFIILMIIVMSVHTSYSN